MSEKTLTWLHLSDLHRSSERDGGWAEIVLRRLKDDLAQRLDEGMQPDLLFFTGDAAFGSLPKHSLNDQFCEAWEWLEGLRELCGVAPERVFLVPGNHDVDRGKVTEATQNWLKTLNDPAKVDAMLEKGGQSWQDFSRRLDHYRDFVGQAYPHLLKLDRQRLVFSEIIPVAGISLGIAGLNTAWSCGESDEKGILWLGSGYQLGAVLPAIQDCDLCIGLMHHPHSWFSPLEDNGTLRSRLQSHFHLLLHGHEHAAWVEAPQAQHLEIAAGATHEKGGDEFGYNLVRWSWPTGGGDPKGEVWLRRWFVGVDRWGPALVPGYSDERGVWPIRWPGKRAMSSGPLSPLTAAVAEPQEMVLEHRPLSRLEERGLFGREGDLAEATRLLAGRRFLWLHGLSGIGKSKLVDGLAQLEGKELRQLRLRKEMSFAEVYGALALELGCREATPPAPQRLLGKLDYRVFREWGNLLVRPRLVHVEGGDSLIDHPERRQIFDLFGEALRQIPVAALVVESQRQPPEENETFGVMRLKGLGQACLGAFFRRPLPARPELGWELSLEELNAISERVAGDRKKLKDLHPLALFLLVQVAAELGLRPPAVFIKFPERFQQKLEKGLFDLLYEQVLTPAEQHMLRLCALYREGVVIPEAHLEKLGERVSDNRAFAGLLHRAILDGTAGGWRLHSLLRQLAQAKRGDGEASDDHGTLGQAWLATIRYKTRYSLLDLSAPNEAFFHLAQAGDYLSMAEIEGRLLRQDVLYQLEELNLRLHREGRTREHRTVLELWTQVEPRNPKPLRFLGEVLSRLEGKASPAARDAFLAAIRLAPDIPQYWSGLGRCLQARREAEEFLTHFQIQPLEVQERLLRDDHVAHVYDQIRLALGGIHVVAALEDRERRLSEGSQNPADYNNHAKWLLSKKEASKALDVLDQARERGIEDAHSLALRDDVLEALGRGGEAAVGREKRLAAGSQHPADYNNHAKWLLSKGEATKALDVLDQARERGTEDAYLLALRDDVLEALGRGGEAAAGREKRLAAGSQNPADYNNHAKWLLSKGEASKALDVLDQARERRTEDAYSLPMRNSVLKALDR